MLSHKSGVFVIDMAAEGFVQFKEPRIISEVHKPVHDSLDLPLLGDPAVQHLFYQTAVLLICGVH